MNFKYLYYQLVATSFLIMAGIAVANFMTFEIVQVGSGGFENIGSELERTFPPHFKFSGMMWIGAIIISLTITYSNQLSFIYPFLIAVISLLIFGFILLYMGYFFQQSWVLDLFGKQRSAFLINFLLCMLASYWLFQRSVLIGKQGQKMPIKGRDDILDEQL